MTMPNEMVLWGARGHAKVLRECVKNLGVKLIALFDNDPAAASPFPDVPLYLGKAGMETWLSQRKTREPAGFLVAIGGDKGKDRLALQDYMESLGMLPLVARHPTAFFAEGCVIGAGSQVLAHASLCVDVNLGRGCIINTAATVDHECRIGPGVHVCPGATLAGCVEVGPYSMIGTGAVILPRMSVGEGAVIGAGAVVTAPVEPYTVVVGNPARVVRRLGI